jgi:hypothetical protein
MERLGPAILTDYEGADEGWDDSLDGLDTITQHQLGVKVVENLETAHSRTIKSIMRSRKLTDLATLPLLRDAKAKVSEWITETEKAHSGLFRDAFEAGRNLRTLEDIR